MAADDADRHQNPDVEDVLRCQKTRGEEQTVARKEKSDEQSGLGEDDQEDADVADRFDEMIQIDWEHPEP